MLYSAMAQTLTGGSPVLCLLGGVIVVVLILLATAIKIVPEYQRLGDPASSFSSR